LTGKVKHAGGGKFNIEREKNFQTQKLRNYFKLHDILVKILWQAQYIVHFSVDKRI